MDENNFTSTTVWFNPAPQSAIDSNGRLRVYRLLEDLHDIMWFPGNTAWTQSDSSPLAVMVGGDLQMPELPSSGVAREFCEIHGVQGWATHVKDNLEIMLCNSIDDQLNAKLELLASGKSSSTTGVFLSHDDNDVNESIKVLKIHLGAGVLLDKRFRPDPETMHGPNVPGNIKLQFKFYWRDVLMNQRCADDRRDYRLVEIEQRLIQTWIEVGQRWTRLFTDKSLCDKDTLAKRYQCTVSHFHMAMLPFGSGSLPNNPSGAQLQSIEDTCAKFHRTLVQERPSEVRCSLTSMTYASIRGAFWEFAPWMCRLALQGIDWNMEHVLITKNERAMKTMLNNIEDLRKQWRDVFGIKVDN